MSESKVKVAIFDNDLRVRKIGKYPLNSDGTKIKIVSGGEGHFMPSIDPSSCLEFPRRSMIPPFKKYFERVYIIKKGASKPVNFHTERVYDINVESIMKAANAQILNRLGQETKDTATITYVIVILLLVIIGKVFGLIV